MLKLYYSLSFLFLGLACAYDVIIISRKNSCASLTSFLLWTLPGVFSCWFSKITEIYILEVYCLCFSPYFFSEEV